MEDIEYLDEYKDLVMPGIKSAAPPASAAGGSRQRRISSDSSNSSSIDADIFQKLFHGKYLDDELDQEGSGSGSKSQDRRARRSPSPYSSSDESNDALEALFSRKSSKSKPFKRRERYESFDSVDDLGEALMRPSQRSTVPKPSTSQAAGARKSHSDVPHTKSNSNSSSSNYGKKPPPVSAGKTAPNRSPNAKGKGSVNGSSLASKNKTVTIIKAQKSDLMPSKHEPKTDPLNLGDLYGDSDSDSSYEYESDFYGDRDSEDEDPEPVIDISTDTSRTTSVAEAARRKQRQNMEKSATERQELVKQIRRRQLREEEERPTLKRSKVDPETKANSKSKFISIIGNETIMSSTKPPIKETKSEVAKTSQAERKSTVRESKHVEITRHIILPPPPRKAMNPGSPTAAVKKPLVQTLLSSTLGLQKPVDGSPVTSKKSLNKSDADENKDGDQPALSSSIVMTKKSLPASKKIESQKDDASSAAPRKVNISVSVVSSSETAAEASKTPGSTPETSPILPRKAQIKKTEANKKSEVIKKAEVKKKTTSQGTQGKPAKSEEAAEPSKKSVSSAATGRKPLPQSEAPKKTESRKSEASSGELNPRKAPPQVDRSKKVEARKSAGASLTAAAREQIPQTDVAKKTEARKSEGSSLPANARKLVSQKDAATKSEARKSEAPPKAATDEEIVKRVPAETIVTTVRGRGSVKKTKPDPRKSKAKPELPSSDVETATDSRDSSRDKSERPVTVSSRQFSLNKSVHMTRAASTNRSLAPTPTPMQRNDSEQQLPMMESSLEKTFKSRGRGGKKGQPAMKRKAEEAADANELAIAKRPREQPDEDLPGFLAFPVKITSTSSTVDPLAVSPTTKPAEQLGKVRKLRVRINRSPFNQWLQEKKNREKQAGLRKLLAPTRETSETDSAAESMSESMRQPQADPAATVVKPASSTAAPAAPPSASVKAQKATQPAKTTLKTAIYPLTEKDLPSDATLSENAKKLENQRRVIQYHAKLMPLPVPIPEVKSEPEDAPPEPMDEDPLMVPLPVAATEAPVAPPPLSGIEDTGPPTTIQINNLAASTSSRVSASHLIPSASAGGNPNSVGQTKMFSFLYPMRYKRAYDDVGLDFCCPNLDGPMRAIDFTRLHSTAEVPVLEVPQFLVITTKLISKGEKNLPSKVRAKMDLMGKAKDLSDSIPASGQTPASEAPPPIIQSIPPAPVAPTKPDSSSIPTTMDTSQFPSAVPSDPAPPVVSQLSRGITKRTSQPGAVIPATASSSMAANLPPTLIQLPPICPADQQRVELQAKVQAFDLVLQTLSRRAANLTVAERQSTIEEIVRTSSLMAIDVDVGTKLLENYVHYLNKVTSTSTPLPQPQISSATPIAANPLLPIASTSSSLSKSIVSSSTASASDTPTPRSSLPTSVPLYDADKNIIGFQCPTAKPPTVGRKAAPAATSTPARASTSSTAAAAKVQLRSTQGGRKSVGGNASQIVNLNTTVSMNKPAPKVIPKNKQAAQGTVTSINQPATVQRQVLCKKKTTPIRTVTQTKTTPSPAAPASTTRAPTKPRATPSTVPDAAPVVAPAGMSLSSTSNPNVFIINQALQPEESILPDSNNAVAPMETEIKGELDDSSEVII
ncbi:platelet binding protein GspB isoform X2 [Drosophila takahashii]|uniref:platelet binding protein GspB isoform X2 n=1 Tax=Drosophila takahashii TaxID=29030 RepID=UPI003898F72C